ncbi:MAG: VWA domain-containing protein [Prevotellaceae bacterium]|jgi:uncharacterized protein YegL|nr:VWA domain-containing protein [Prevotellaceae bacterium]
MAKNDFSAESAINYEQKCLCVLVLDVSGSMREIIGGDVKYTGRQEIVDGKLYNIVEGDTMKIDKLNNGLQDFYHEILADDSTSQKLEVSLITFSDYVTTVQEPALVENFTMPALEANGETSLADAVNEAINKVQARKDWYKSTGQNYYRPWIILMTDGEPSKGQDVGSLASRIKADTAAKKYAFLPIGVDKANMSVLNQIAGNIPAMQLQGAKFSQFFKWLSASMGTVVNHEEGAKVDLTQGADDWMTAFTI